MGGERCHYLLYYIATRSPDHASHVTWFLITNPLIARVEDLTRGPSCRRSRQRPERSAVCWATFQLRYRRKTGRFSNLTMLDLMLGRHTLFLGTGLNGFAQMFGGDWQLGISLLRRVSLGEHACSDGHVRSYDHKLAERSVSSSTA